MRGELDLQAEELTVEDIAALEEAAQGGHQALHLMPGSWHLALEPNLAYQEEPLRTFLGDRRVREALALAMDRETINTLCYEGRCKPRQYSPVRASPYYDEAMAKATTPTTPRAPQRCWTRAGYGMRDARAGAPACDGQRLAVQLITTSGEGSPAAGQRSWWPAS
jgi:peptide/nickel transport system substrate-binding protein